MIFFSKKPKGVVILSKPMRQAVYENGEIRALNEMDDMVKLDIVAVLLEPDLYRAQLEFSAGLKEQELLPLIEKKLSSVLPFTVQDVDLDYSLRKEGELWLVDLVAVSCVKKKQYIDEFPPLGEGNVVWLGVSALSEASQKDEVLLAKEAVSLVEKADSGSVILLPSV